MNLTPATLTVTVNEKNPRLRFRKVPGRPGLMRVFNPNKFAVSVLLGSVDSKLAHHVEIGPRYSKKEKVNPRLTYRFEARKRLDHTRVDSGVIKISKLQRSI